VEGQGHHFIRINPEFPLADHPRILRALFNNEGGLDAVLAIDQAIEKILTRKVNT